MEEIEKGVVIEQEEEIEQDVGVKLKELLQVRPSFAEKVADLVLVAEKWEEEKTAELGEGRKLVELQ